ncbi:TetR/AcrR family transcriptional regulator [Amphibacillus sp. Q70]|uniref:TetR/AcrR family transcriptional regulator n=1 Tax=Amphibacillus sp. Q70 TaxID=3453416 RepID=UPI003F866CC2
MNGFEKRTEEKRKRVLIATFELMNQETNVGNVTMDAIASHSNVAKATIFKYFGNKDNLIREVYIYYIDQLVEEAQQIIAEDKSFEETLIALSQNKINLLNKINQSFYLKMMEYFTEKNEADMSKMQQYTEQNHQMLLDVFHRGRKEGKVDLKYSDEFLLLYFQTLVEGMSNPKIYEKIAPYTEEWTEMLIKGIAPMKRE